MRNIKLAGIAAMVGMFSMLILGATSYRSGGFAFVFFTGIILLLWAIWCVIYIKPEEDTEK